MSDNKIDFNVPSTRDLPFSGIMKSRFVSEVKIIPTHEDLEKFGIPKYETQDSAACDIRVFFEGGKDYLTIYPGQTVVLTTGFKIHIDNPYIALQILPRSGLGIKHGIILSNVVGLIDSDYQGEVKVALWNRSHEAFTIKHGDRVAQGVFMPIVKANFKVVEKFDTETLRGEGGFGHTGSN